MSSCCTRWVHAHTFMAHIGCSRRAELPQVGTVHATTVGRADDRETDTRDGSQVIAAVIRVWWVGRKIGGGQVGEIPPAPRCPKTDVGSPVILYHPSLPYARIYIITGTNPYGGCAWLPVGASTGLAQDRCPRVRLEQPARTQQMAVI